MFYNKNKFGEPKLIKPYNFFYIYLIFGNLFILLIKNYL